VKSPATKIVDTTKDAPVGNTLVLASGPVVAEDELATCVASFLTGFNNLACGISGLTDELLGQERKLAGRYRDELIPMLFQMQILLSQRGALHELVANDPSLMGDLAQLEGVPTWTKWYEAFANSFHGAKSLRQVQRQLKKLRGKAQSEADADTEFNARHDSNTDTGEVSYDSDLYRNDDGKLALELLAEHAGSHFTF
jgi:hypothetical protein